MQILTEGMELAGEVLQDLAAFLQISELESSAEFPTEMEAFRAVLQHGQSGRLGEAIAGHHGLLRLRSKAWGCSTHSGGGVWCLRPPQKAMALQPQAAKVDVFAAFDRSGAAAGR